MAAHRPAIVSPIIIITPAATSTRSSQRRGNRARTIMLTTEKDAVRLHARDGRAADRRRCRSRSPSSPLPRVARGPAAEYPLRMRHRLEYLIVKAVELCVRPLPLRLVRTLGEGLGLMFYLVDRVHRRIALANLEVAFPKRPANERRAIARSMFRALRPAAARAAEVRVAAASTTSSDLVEWEGEERVRLALAQGKGILFCTGPFRLLGAAGARARAEVRADGRHGAPARQSEAARTARAHSHVERQPGGVSARRGAKGAAAARRRQRRRHPDRSAHDERRRRSTWIFSAGRPRPRRRSRRSRLRTGAPVIPLFAFPLPNGRYRMIYEHPVEPPRHDSPDAVREFTQRCTDVLEMHVRRHPELWLWMHRRWRDSAGPALDAAPGMFPSAKADSGNRGIGIETIV